MKTKLTIATWLFLIAAFAPVLPGTLVAAEWSIPVAGNGFPTPVDTDPTRSSQNGRNIFFHVDRPCDLKLSLMARSFKGKLELMLKCGQESMNTTVNGLSEIRQEVGTIQIQDAGYVKVTLNARSNDAPRWGEIDQLVVDSDTDDLELSFVKSNTGNMFYWGRRGPSVHLRYEVPRKTSLRYAYSEITVPKGSDPQGSYFMANGFGQGYFGIQVNGPTERRVLFSVWSPFKTDNPKDIPPDQRVIALAKGDAVRVNDFGNEGSGGQSYLIYPWVAGTTYRFLTEVKPDGNGNTIYTSWFGERPTETNDKPWMLIARFRRPKTDVNLTGFHSFLENFNPNWGHIARKAFHGNVWVCDTTGKWHECVKARFSVDATGGGQHRLDFAGGAEGNRFYLRNCGFFNETGTPGSVFERESTPAKQPSIKFDELPSGDEETETKD